MNDWENAKVKVIFGLLLKVQVGLNFCGDGDDAIYVHRSKSYPGCLF